MRRAAKSVTWIEPHKVRAREEKEARSLYGRKRRFQMRGSKTKYKQARQAVNMPVQSSVSDMTLLANIRAVRVLHVAGIAYRQWPHIHDGFLIQVEEDQVNRAWRLVAATMDAPGFETDVPFVAEVAVGRSWGGLEKVWNGLKPDGSGEEDEAILARYGATPDFP